MLSGSFVVNVSIYRQMSLLVHLNISCVVDKQGGEVNLSFAYSSSSNTENTKLLFVQRRTYHCSIASLNTGWTHSVQFIYVHVFLRSAVHSSHTPLHHAHTLSSAGVRTIRSVAVYLCCSLNRMHHFPLNSPIGVGAVGSICL